MSPLHPPIFTFRCQWPDLLRPQKSNWVDFDFLVLACEYDKIGAHFEIELALLGLGLRITIPTGETKESRYVAEQQEAIKSGEVPTMPMLEILKKISAETGIPIERIMAPPGFMR